MRRPEASSATCAVVLALVTLKTPRRIGCGSAAPGRQSQASFGLHSSAADSLMPNELNDQATSIGAAPCARGAIPASDCGHRDRKSGLADIVRSPVRPDGRQHCELSNSHGGSVMTGKISAELERFLRRYVESFDEFNVLLLVAAGPRPWTSESLAQSLEMTPAAAESALGHLVARALVAGPWVSDKTYNCAPPSADIDLMVKALAAEV